MSLWLKRKLFAPAIALAGGFYGAMIELAAGGTVAVISALVTGNLVYKAL